jgi:hypothetical protein
MRLSKELWIDGITLMKIGETVRHYEEKYRDFEVKDWLDEIIDDVVKKEEYYEPPKKKQRVAANAVFKRKHTSPVGAYMALLRLLRDANGCLTHTGRHSQKSWITQKSWIADLIKTYNLSDYADPTTIDSTLILDAAKVIGVRGNMGSIFVKPTAMHAWLSRCSLMEKQMEQPTIRIALLDDQSQIEAVRTDPYGFNMLPQHELRLFLGGSPSELVASKRGILCAVLTLPSLVTLTGAYTVQTRSLQANLAVNGASVSLSLKVHHSAYSEAAMSLGTELVVHDIRSVLPLGCV